MKIAYVFHHDAANPAIQSGRPAALLEEFQRQGHAVERIFPLQVQPARTEFAKKVGYRLLRRHHRHDRAEGYLQALAEQFNTRAAGRDFDLVFSPGSEAVSHLPPGLPVAYCADATFANLVDYYWDFTGLSEDYIRQGYAQEKAALSRALLAVYPSEWAAKAAIEQHGADPSRVVVIPFGANLGSDNRRAGIMAAIARRPTDTIRLLFVGRHWQRKGGELVIATAMCLIAHGHKVTVDIVGCDLPAEYRDVSWIRGHGLLHQTNPADMIALRQLYAESHFLFVPSRAEAYGLIFTEANAFGVPSVATNTGGIPAVVRNGHNGLLLPLDAQPSHYADAIVATFSEPQRYEAMAHRAFAEFEERLNWGAFTRQFLDHAQERIAARQSAPRRLMQADAPTLRPWPEALPVEATAPSAGGLRPACGIALLAGVLTAFTVSVVGEMPLGELVLFAVAAWAGLCVVVHQGLPGALFQTRYFGVLLACQAVALLAYVGSDFYRHSDPRDMARGWARMIFLAVDLVAIAYLFGRGRGVFYWLLGGLLAGDLINAVFFGALFGDMWKFGYGIPATYAALALASLAGPMTVMLVAAGFGALHFALDFRSVGALCIGVAAATALQMIPRRWRLWTLPVGALAALGVATVLFGGLRSGDEMAHRSSRSDVDRSAMIQAATEAFVASPLIGHGSWFSRTDVFGNFMQIRDDLAKAAGIGGFAGPNEEPEAVALHSQILVTLAEGGLFGASFFFVYGAGLAWALWDQVMVQPWNRGRPVRVLVLMLATWHLFMSPFSGAHRVYIALATGLVLLVLAERNPREAA